MKKFILGLLISTLAATSFSHSFAMDLDAARAANKITELPTGYVKANDDSVKALADEVNAKRREAYKKVAEKTGATMEQVGVQAAKKIQEKLEK